MKVFFDTSVLVAAVLDDHESHARAFAALERVQSGQDEGIIAGRNLAEMYAVLTRLPQPFRHAPEQALLSIEENVVSYFKVAGLAGHDYVALIREAALTGIQGGTIYDAVLVKTAGKFGVDRIYTLNVKHFQAVAPKSLAAIVSAP